MNKEELFQKYKVDKSHSEWDNMIDNWESVEIFRMMHDGRLPNEKDTSTKYILDFADKLRSEKGLLDLVSRDDFGNLYLTSKRMIYRYADLILEEVNRR